MSSILYGSSREQLQGLVTRDLAAFEREPLSEQPVHLGGDLLEIVLAHRLRELEIVVETILDGRPDGHFGARIQSDGSLGQHVGSGVTDDLQALRR